MLPLPTDTAMNAAGADHSQKIARYEQYLQRDPDNALLLMSLGDLHHQAGHLEQAASHYQRCMGRPTHARIARGRLANVLISEHKFAEADTLLRELIDSGDGDAALLYNLGLCVYYQQRWQEALTLFEQARQHGQDHADNARYRAYALHHLGDIEAALQACRDSLSAAPSEPLNGYLALLEMDAGDTPNAHQRAQQVLARQPDNHDAALVEGMWFAEQQEPERARQYFDQVVAAEPTNPRAWLGRGLERLYSNDHASAIGAFETAIQYMPKHVGTIVTLAWTRYTQGDLLGAERTFREAIAVDRNFGEAHGGLAVVLLYLRQIDEARRECRIAQRLGPDGFGAVWAHGVLLALDGKRAQGEAEVSAALQRPITADGRTLYDHLQVFLRKQAGQSAAPSAARLLPDASRAAAKLLPNATQKGKTR